MNKCRVIDNENNYVSGPIEVPIFDGDRPPMEGYDKAVIHPDENGFYNILPAKKLFELYATYGLPQSIIIECAAKYNALCDIRGLRELLFNERLKNRKLAKQKRSLNEVRQSLQNNNQ